MGIVELVSRHRRGLVLFFGVLFLLFAFAWSQTDRDPPPPVTENFALGSREILDNALSSSPGQIQQKAKVGVYLQPFYLANTTDDFLRVDLESRVFAGSDDDLVLAEKSFDLPPGQGKKVALLLRSEPVAGEIIARASLQREQIPARGASISLRPSLSLRIPFVFGSADIEDDAEEFALLPTKIRQTAQGSSPLVQIKNESSSAIDPRGGVVVYRGDRVVAAGVLEADQVLLPAATREIESGLFFALPPGRYRIKTSVWVGSEKKSRVDDVVVR